MCVDAPQVLTDPQHACFDRPRTCIDAWHNCDPTIIPYLNAVYGTAYGRVEGKDRFEEEPFKGWSKGD
jgi:hypothetical protein